MDGLIACCRGRKPTDGRWVIAAALLGCFVLLAAFIHSGGYVAGWNRFGVPGVQPCFSDLRGITAGGDSYRLGHDPLGDNLEDPWHRPLNYPRVWHLAVVFFGLHQTDTMALGFGLAAIFYSSVFLFAGRITFGQGAWWAALLCAPPTMLAVERGNNDLVIFSLLALALTAARPWLVYLAVGCCAVLKLYPVCAFLLAWRETPRRALGILAVAGLAFAAYLAAMRHDLPAIEAGVPRSVWMSYGSGVYFHWLSPPGEPDGLPWYCPALAVTMTLFLACLTRLRVPGPAPLRRTEADGLMIGGALYAATFVLNINYNYRLIVLLLTVPALLHLLESAAAFYRRLARTLLVSMVVGWWLSPRLEMTPFFIKEAASWAVFAGMSFLLLQFLPSWREWVEEIHALPLNSQKSTASIQTVSATHLLHQHPMKKLLILGAAVLGLCTIGQTARAGDDGPSYNYQRPAHDYEPDYCPPRARVGFYLPPPPFFCPPRVVYYRRPHYRRHHYSYPYGYAYGCAPGVHIGIGF